MLREECFSEERVGIKYKNVNILGSRTRVLLYKGIIKLLILNYCALNIYATVTLLHVPTCALCILLLYILLLYYVEIQKKKTGAR